MAMSVTYTTIGGVIVHEALSGNRERELTADPLGSLVKIRTSVFGYSYSAEYWPYGEIQTQTGSNPTRWAFVGLLGYMRDLATMFYVRARYYRPAQTRWMTVDPLRSTILNGSIALSAFLRTALATFLTAYAYSNGSPAVHRDASGLMPDCESEYKRCLDDTYSRYVDRVIKVAIGFGISIVLCVICHLITCLNPATWMACYICGASCRGVWAMLLGVRVAIEHIRDIEECQCYAHRLICEGNCDLPDCVGYVRQNIEGEVFPERALAGTWS